MSKKFLGTALTFLFSLGAFHAQDAHASFSVKGGLGLSKIAVTSVAGESVDGYAYGMGYSIGASMDFGAGPVGVLVDALYADRKAKFGSETSSEKWIHIPVQVRFSLMPMVYLSTGGFYAHALGDDVGADYGAVGGVGISLPLGVSTMTLEARYNHGLANILEVSAGDAAINTRSIDLLVGIRF